MKTETKRTFFITCLVVVWIAIFLSECRADDYNVWTDFLKFNKISLDVAGTFTSDHKNQCNPWCAFQENGGHGIQIGIFGYISVTNSYKDPAEIRYIEAYDFEFNYETMGFEVFRAVKFGLPIWIMEIRGYVYEERTEEYYHDESGEVRNRKKYDPITVGPIPWVVEQIAVNPIFIIEKLAGIKPINHEFWITYNIIHFPVVRIQWWSLEFKYDF